MTEKTVLNKDDIKKIICDTAKKVLTDIPDIEKFAIVGIQTRGVELSNRIKKELEDLSGKSIQCGILDITFYRDDLTTRGSLPIIKETRINFDISDMTILLVDDVIFTGRTIKAALETLTGFGRPRAIRLFGLIDRGNRQLPIQPDYCGYHIETSVNDNIRVLLSGTDKVDDSVVLCTGQI